jgi:hypothetical protein
MIKPILLASAFALAAPVLAQSTTNDDTPVEAAPGTAADITQPQDKAPVTPAQTPTLATPDTDDPENDRETTDDASTAVTDSATTTKVETGATMETTAAQAPATVTDFTGVGGPIEAARDYPVCTRTITDRCLQLRNSPRPPE